MTLGQLSTVLNIRVRKIQEKCLNYYLEHHASVISKCVHYSGTKMDPYITREEADTILKLFEVDKRICDAVEELIAGDIHKYPGELKVGLNIPPK